MEAVEAVEAEEVEEVEEAEEVELVAEAAVKLVVERAEAEMMSPLMGGRSSATPTTMWKIVAAAAAATRLI